MIKPPLEAPTREDRLIFQGLQKALVQNKAFIKISFKRLNRRGSPFFNPWENILPLLAMLLLSLTVMVIDTLVMGTIILTVFSLIYAMLFPYLMEPVMKNRVIKRIIPRIEKFLVAWHYGGIVLVLGADSSYYCVAPWGDWRSFTKTYFSDLIPADEAEEGKDE